MGGSESKTVATDLSDMEVEEGASNGRSKPLDTQEKELAQALQRVVSKHQLPRATKSDDDGWNLPNEVVVGFHDEDAESIAGELDGELDSEVSGDVYKSARRQTFVDYVEMAKIDESSGGPGSTKKRDKQGKKFATLVKQRSNVHTLKKGKTKRDLRSRTGKNLEQAAKLQKKFFADLSSKKGTKNDPKRRSARRGLGVFEGASTIHKPYIDQVKRTEAAVESSVKFQYIKLERELQKLINNARHAVQKDPKAQEAQAKAVAEVSAVRKRLLNRQKVHFATAKEEAIELEKQIKAKIKHLEAEKKQKAGENYRVTHAALIKEEQEKKKHRYSLFRRAKKEMKKIIVSPEQAALEEEELKKDLERINSSIVDLRDALTLMQLEKQFPRTMRWKLRVDAGGGLYVGMRDVEVERLHAKYHVESGGETGVIRMRVFDLEAVIGILEFVFAGKSYLARFLGGVFTPTVNRLDLVCHGEWELWLRYNPKTSSWDEDPKRSKFNLDFKKKVTGITTIRLPAAFVKLLTNTIFPLLISAGLKDAFPAQLATFEYEGKEASSLPYLAQEDTHIDIRGTLAIIGDMSPNVWRCPLIGPTPEALAARKALGGEYPVTQEEAVILDYMLRGPRAAAAGFANKAATLARLYKWRLKYASYNLSELEELFSLIQLDAKARMPAGWFSQIMYRVELLALKPVTLDVEVHSAEVEVDLQEITKTSMQLFLAERERALESAKSEKAKAVAQKELNLFKTKIVSTMSSINFVKNILNNSISAEASMFVYGGEEGFVALEVRDLKGVGRVPSFRLPTVIPSQEEDIPIEVHGEDGPGEGEYTVMIYDPMRDSEDKENGTFIILSDIAIELLPKGGGPGCVRARAERLRASAFFPSLDDVLTFLLVGDKAKQEKQSRNVKFRNRNREVRRLLNNAYSVVSRLKGLSPSEDVSQMLTEEEERTNPYSQLPDFLIFDHHKFVTEVKGVSVAVEKKKDQMKLIVKYNLKRDQYVEPLKLRMRQNLADVFEAL